MKVLGIGNIKGGVGKSTLATSLAAMFAAEMRTLLIDTDERQHSSMDFKAMRPEGLPDFACVAVQKPVLRKDIGKYASSFDIVVIDTGATDSALMRDAMLASDVFLVPVQPGYYDMWSSQGTFELINEAFMGHDEKIAVSVFNRVIQNTQLEAAAAEQVPEFTERYGVRFLNTKICNRQAYVKTAGKGICVAEEQGSDKDAKAADEMLSLYKELKEILNV
jgi:chromosome partitioning protein